MNDNGSRQQFPSPRPTLSERGRRIVHERAEDKHVADDVHLLCHNPHNQTPRLTRMA